MIRANITKFCILINRKIKNFFYKFFLKPYYRSQFKKIGKNVYIGKNCTLFYKNIEIGDNVIIGNYANFTASLSQIHIGNYVLFGPNVTIMGGDHRIDLKGKYIFDITEDLKEEKNDKDVFIDDDVWIGCNVTILKGVHVGRGAIIGAGSVVVKDVKPYTIHVGCHNSADFLRFTKEEIIEHENILYGKIISEDYINSLNEN